MPGKFLIDLTDPRFSIPENGDVLEFIRRTNPFAHTDVGGLLFDLRGELAGARAYCPAPASCAYVVLHTAADRIFAIAFGQRGLAFRIGGGARAEALADGAAPAPEIGPDWIRLDPWDSERRNDGGARIRRLAGAAFDQACNPTI
jgi:hypothetical protein